MPDVSTDDVFVETDGGSKIPTGPERLSLVESVGTFDFFLHPGRGFAFDYLHEVGD